MSEMGMAVEALVVYCRRAETAGLQYVEVVDSAIVKCIAADVWAGCPLPLPLSLPLPLLLLSLRSSQIPQKLECLHLHPDYLPLLPLQTEHHSKASLAVVIPAVQARRSSGSHSLKPRAIVMSVGSGLILIEGPGAWGPLCFWEACRSVQGWARVEPHALLACLKLGIARPNTRSR